MNDKKRLKTRHDGGNSPLSRFILQTYFNCQLLLFILPFAAVSVCENGDTEFFTVLKLDRWSFWGVKERSEGGLWLQRRGRGRGWTAPVFHCSILPFLSWRWKMKKRKWREGPGGRVAPDSAPDSAPSSGSPGAHRRAKHYVPHSRGFVLLIIINPASQIYSANAGGHMFKTVSNQIDSWKSIVQSEFTVRFKNMLPGFSPQITTNNVNISSVGSSAGCFPPPWSQWVHSDTWGSRALKQESSQGGLEARRRLIAAIKRPSVCLKSTRDTLMEW